MTTLYRKYRPLTFADVEAQEHIVTTLKNEITSGTLAHAYIFAGPRGVGKTTLARLLAKAVVCTGKKPGDAEPCNTCANCLDVNAGRHIDIIEIDAASHTGVDNVRENIIDNARFQPTRAAYKIFIIDEVHMLSGSAFNALLKTLEEPPAHVLFILATTEMHKLPATVVSRCQRFQFKKIPHDAAIAKLKKICAAEGVKVDTAVLERVANAAGGALRDAESILGQLFSLQLKKITLEDSTLILPTVDSNLLIAILEAVAANKPSDALQTLDAMIENGAEAGHVLDDLIELLRQALVFRTTKNDTVLITRYEANDVKRLKNLATETKPSTLIALIENALLRRGQLRVSPHPYLPLELFIINGVSTQSKTIIVPPIKNAEPKVGTKATTQKIAEMPVTVSEPTKPAPQKIVAAPEEKPPSLVETIKTTIENITGLYEPPKTTLEQLEKNWAPLVQKISSHNHALTFILSMSKPGSIAPDGLHVCVPYSLHRDKLIEAKNRQIIERCLFETFGEKIKFHCSVESPVVATEPEPEIQNVALEFGGEVVG